MGPELPEAGHVSSRMRLRVGSEHGDPRGPDVLKDGRASRVATANTQTH